MKIFLCVATLFLALQMNSGAICADYYVSTDGNDAGAGSQSIPFHSIGKGFSVLKPGDTLHVLAGKHALSTVVTMNFSGEPGKPITIQGEKGAVIVGTFNKGSNAKEHGPDSYCGLKVFGKWGVIKGLEFANMGGACIGGEVQNFVFDGLCLHDYSNYALILSKSRSVRIDTAGCIIQRMSMACI